MIPLFTAHLLQSTCFAAGAGLLTLAFRKNRAQVRYWLWLSVSLKFLIPFALLTSLGSYLEMRMPAAHQIATRIATPQVSYTLEQFSNTSLTVTAPPTMDAPDAAYWIAATLFVLWLAGFAALAFIRFRSWLRVRDAVRAGRPLDIAATVEVRSTPVISTPSMLEPGVVGILRPVLLLPEGIADRLTPSELKAVLAHEVCHVRRRDNLFATIHMIAETIFWFHPLIWWIGARLVEERERACDEEVLRLGNEPDTYADAILNVCKLYVESPLACASGVSGAGIRGRVEAIMLNRRLPELNRAKKLLLASAGGAVLTGPILAGLLVAQTTKPLATGPKQKFEVASIRPCDPVAASARRGEGGEGGGGGEGGRGIWSPGRIARTCVTTMTFIQDAYIRYADGKTEPTFALQLPPVKGAPAWVTSDRYTLEAKAEGKASRPAMYGPMLQSLMEDRFRLKLHAETRIVPTYELTAAKSGLKLKPAIDEPGKCTLTLPRGMNPKGADGMNLPGFSADGHFNIPPPAAGQPCHMMVTLMHGRNNFLVAKAIQMDELTSYLARSTDRPVFDKTGLNGKFDIVLEFAPDETAQASSGTPSDVPGVVTAVEQQLGLKLMSAKGPGNFFVIDHIEKPSGN
jgi:uncharacterized protein (TIGR03435 family)